MIQISSILTDFRGMIIVVFDHLFAIALIFVHIIKRNMEACF